MDDKEDALANLTQEIWNAETTTEKPERLWKLKRYCLLIMSDDEVEQTIADTLLEIAYWKRGGGDVRPINLGNFGSRRKSHKGKQKTGRCRGGKVRFKIRRHSSNPHSFVCS